MVALALGACAGSSEPGAAAGEDSAPAATASGEAPPGAEAGEGAAEAGPPATRADETAPELPLATDADGMSSGEAAAEEAGGEPSTDEPAPEDAEPSPAAEGAPDVPAANVDPTGGSGGPKGPVEAVAPTGLTFRIDAPDDDAPHGLLVLLHGSTASNYDRFVPGMRDVAEAYDLIPVSVFAPNGQGWNEGNQVRAAELLHRLLQEDLFRLYNVDRSRIVFSGQSSGGGFLASNFVPAYADQYRGGAFFQCGAAPPNVTFQPAPETRAHFRLHFEITTGDDIWPAYYAAAVEAYSRAGMTLTEDATKPGGHCQFDQQQVIFDHIDAMLRP